MTVAISFSSVKDKTSNNQIYGLQVAVSDWLRAYFRYSRSETFSFLVMNKDALDEIEENAATVGLDMKRLRAFDARYPQENLWQFDTVFRTDPMPGHLLWQRALLPDPGFAFCGLSHSIAGYETGDILEQYCLAPTTVGDAIVCPSHAIKAVIRRFWDSYSDYIEQRFGAKFNCPVRQPIIPLGVDLARFERSVTPAERAAQRATLGYDENDIVILWVGRLSSAIKAHPISMFRAVEEAAKRTSKRVHFLMVGYFVPESASDAFQELAADLCPTADVQFIASNDPRFPNGLWAGGDIFLSLIENMQESFGLTPVEAIAAGLPRVITDWDGYRDCVQHGVDGFLIPTIQPPPGQGGALSAQLLGGREMYGGFLAKTALSVAVDSHAAAEALVRLIDNPDLRQRMASAAKLRLPTYDWKNIIPLYEDLWDEIAAERKSALAHAPSLRWAAIPPQVPDPFTMYEAFPSAILKTTDRLAIIATADDIRKLWRHEMNVMAMDIMPHPETLMAVIQMISAQGTASVAEILSYAAAKEKDTSKLWRSLTWLLKLGIARLV